MKRWTVLILILLCFGLSTRAELFPSSTKVYRQGSDTWVKLTAGNKSLRPFEHPHAFTEAEMDRCLGSVRYFRPALAAFTGKQGSEWDLLTAEERAKIVPPLVQAFAQAGPDEWVDFSIGVYRGGTLLSTYRQSEGVMFIKNGELNIAFRRIAFRKAPGEASLTSDPTRAYDSKVRIRPAEDQRLEQSPGHGGNPRDHLNWVVISLEPGTPASSEPAAAAPAPSSGATTPSAGPAPSPASVHERLKELKQMYEEGLISRDEYEKKREEILKQL